MKYLSKINRGAILTAGVVLVVIVYLITNAIIQFNAKPAIKKVCEAYLQQELAYNMLPAEYQKDKPGMSDAELKNYLAEMKKNIIAFYPDNELYYKFVIQNLTENLTNQSKGVGIVYQYTKTILKYNEMLFDGNTVDIRITCNTTIEAKGLMGIASSTKDKVTSEVQDNIILEKINGQWKVIYASINRPTSENFPGKTGYTTTYGKY